MKNGTQQSALPRGHIAQKFCKLDNEQHFVVEPNIDSHLLNYRLQRCY